MAANGTAKGELIDESALTLEELARACAVETEWVVEHIESGLLADGSRYVANWRFTSRDLTRARRLRQFERDFEAEPELAALVADLLEQVERLKGRLRAAGLSSE
jgi:chaperone modulatory protein CbpM